MNLIKLRFLSTSIDLIDPTASLALAQDVAQYFDVKPIEMKKIIKEVGGVVVKWRQEAKKLKIKKAEIDRMASAFEHEDLQKALQ